MSPTHTDLYYPTGADTGLYVFGETYNGDGTKLIHKLKQMQRLADVLCAKCGTVDATECIAGAVFMGPGLSKARCTGLLTALTENKDALPHLWALADCGRLLCYQTSNDCTLQLASEVQELRKQLFELRARIAPASASAES